MISKAVDDQANQSHISPIPLILPWKDELANLLCFMVFPPLAFLCQSFHDKLKQRCPPPLQWFSSIYVQIIHPFVTLSILYTWSDQHCLFELIMLLFHARTVEVTKGERGFKESDTARNSTTRLTLFKWLLRCIAFVQGCSGMLRWTLIE